MAERKRGRMKMDPYMTREVIVADDFMAELVGYLNGDEKFSGPFGSKPGLSLYTALGKHLRFTLADAITPPREAL